MCLSSSLSLTFVFCHWLCVAISTGFHDRANCGNNSRRCQLWKQLPIGFHDRADCGNNSRRCQLWKQLPVFTQCHFLKFNVIFKIQCLGHKTLKKWCWLDWCWLDWLIDWSIDWFWLDWLMLTLVSEDESCLLVKIVNWRKLWIDEGWTSLRSDSLWWFACGDVISTVRYSILHQLKIKWIKWIKWILR